ncbi:Rv3654c family TadE-like protein [Nocardia sp. CWNU-33]|uniref:Rv3654c family TadE-like protein n=1 Tax=Nocardia sp. CWNU-33 TaxID=3392117 RepID=UPI00398F1ADC
MIEQPARGTVCSAAQWLRAVRYGTANGLLSDGQVLNRRRAEQGGATVLACLALVGLIGATLLVGQVGVVVVSRHRAQAAADLAALAAAGALEQGAEAGCAQALEIARRMRVRIHECEVTHWDVTVTVVRNVPIGLYGNWTVRAVARAGPVEDGV